MLRSRRENNRKEKSISNIDCVEIVKEETRNLLVGPRRSGGAFLAPQERFTRPLLPRSLRRKRQQKSLGRKECVEVTLGKVALDLTINGANAGAGDLNTEFRRRPSTEAITSRAVGQRDPCYRL